MGKYSIKELEQLSGIKAHTIRIWEKRHGLIQPQRTQTNIRYYSDEDLKKIINVAILNNYGHKISKIAHLSSSELASQVSALLETNESASLYIDQFVVAMIDLEEEKFEKLFSSLILKFGFEYTITEIIYPFLEKIGVLWQTGGITPAQEHFISNLIRQKLIVAIDALAIPPKTSRRIVLFLPEDELHELGLLFHHYIVRKAGFRTYYLGQSVPYEDLKKIAEEHKPDFFVTSMTSHPPQKVLQDYLLKISEDFSSNQILVTGAVIRKSVVKIPSNVHFFHNSESLRDFLIK